MRLRFKLYSLLGLMMSIIWIGGSITFWYSFHVDRMLTDLLRQNLAAFELAEALESALVNQKGFVSYYFLDSDPDWLRQLGEYRQIFKTKLEQIKTLEMASTARESIALIETEYKAYIKIKDQVIELYTAGHRVEGMNLHKKVRRHFFKLLQLCEAYKEYHHNKIEMMKEKSRVESRRLRYVTGFALFGALLLAGLLAFILMHQVLKPIHRLTRATIRDKGEKQEKDEISALSRGVADIIEDMGHTREELKKSRKHLFQSEKMAMIGKLAAGTAHSIRNPLTSVKMRLFSLNRSLNLTVNQKDDFDVISDEIKHIDTIVQNFLEFSRPPKLKIQTISPSDVVDQVLQLLQHRLKSYDVSAGVVRTDRLPPIAVDPEQLKEVFCNLIENACEAMGLGGRIWIHERTVKEESLRHFIEIQVQDDGPGIPPEIAPKIFQPFFTSKDEGTGLGLPIAVRILEEHGGDIDFVSKENEGTSFFVRLPIKEANCGQDLDR